MISEAHGLFSPSTDLAKIPSTWRCQNGGSKGWRQQEGLVTQGLAFQKRSSIHSCPMPISKGFQWGDAQDPICSLEGFSWRHSKARSPVRRLWEEAWWKLARRAQLWQVFRLETHCTWFLFRHGSRSGRRRYLEWLLTFKLVLIAGSERNTDKMKFGEEWRDMLRCIQQPHLFTQHTPWKQRSL